MLKRSIFFLVITVLLGYGSCTKPPVVITGQVAVPDGAIVRIIFNRKILAESKVSKQKFYIEKRGVPERIYSLIIFWPNKNKRVYNNGASDPDSLDSYIRIYLQANYRYEITSPQKDVKVVANATSRDTGILPLRIHTSSTFARDLMELENNVDKMVKLLRNRKDSLGKAMDIALNRGNDTEYNLLAEELRTVEKNYFVPLLRHEYDEFMVTHLHSAITLYLISNVSDLFQRKPFYSNIMKRLDRKLDGNYYRQQAAKRLNALKELAVGNTAPKITGENPDGNPIRLKYGTSFTLVEFLGLLVWSLQGI